MQTQTTLRPYPGALLDPKHDPIFKSLFTQNTEDSQKALDSISQSDEEWRRERDYIDAVNTEISIRNTAIREGVKQGIQQGIQQGARENAIENAKNFLKMKIGSYEQIAQGTGLTLEEVMKLAEEIK